MDVSDMPILQMGMIEIPWHNFGDETIRLCEQVFQSRDWYYQQLFHCFRLCYILMPQYYNTLFLLTLFSRLE